MGHDGYYLLGSFTRVHGVKGNLILKPDTDDPARYRKTKKLFIEIDGALREFSSQTLSVGPQQLIIHLEGLDDRDEAASFIRCDVYLPLSELPPSKGNHIYFHEAIGMKMVDDRAGELGVIDTIYDLPHQPVAQVLYLGKEVLIPFIQQFILKIDRKEGIIYMALPEGLLEVYTQ